MPRRRDKGDGQLSWDDKRQAWRARIALTPGATRVRYFAARQSGSRRQAEADAKAWLKAQVAAKQAGRNLKAARMSIDAAVAEWLASRDYLAESTLTNYRTIALHISDAIGGTPAENVTAIDIERMDKTHRTKLSGDYADQILTMLASVFERLIALDVVLRNPVTTYRRIIPKRARRGTPTRAPHPLDAGMLRLLLAKLDDPYRGFALWLMCTGLRISELNGLRSVNARDGVATIVEQRRSTSRHAPRELKTGASQRQIPVAAQLLAQTQVGRTLVFEHADGGALTQTTFRAHFARALQSAGLPHIRPHDLRHSFGRGLIGLGCPEELREALMGHKAQTQNQEYSRPPIAVLRPWVEAWAAQVLGEAQPQRREA